MKKSVIRKIFYIILENYTNDMFEFSQFNKKLFLNASFKKISKSYLPIKILFSIYFLIYFLSQFPLNIISKITRSSKISLFIKFPLISKVAGPINRILKFIYLSMKYNDL